MNTQKSQVEVIDTESKLDMLSLILAKKPCNELIKSGYFTNLNEGSLLDNLPIFRHYHVVKYLIINYIDTEKFETKDGLSFKTDWQKNFKLDDIERTIDLLLNHFCPILDGEVVDMTGRTSQEILNGLSSPQN